MIDTKVFRVSDGAIRSQTTSMQRFERIKTCATPTLRCCNSTRSSLLWYSNALSRIIQATAQSERLLRCWPCCTLRTDSPLLRRALSTRSPSSRRVRLLPALTSPTAGRLHMSQSCPQPALLTDPGNPRKTPTISSPILPSTRVKTELLRYSDSPPGRKYRTSPPRQTGTT